MIMDTNKCIACQSCTIACKSTWTWGKGQEFMLWNNIETKPFGFYPMGWDVNVLELLGDQQWEGGTYTGETIFEAAPPGERVLGWTPSEEDWSHPNIGEDEPTATPGRRRTSPAALDDVDVLPATDLQPLHLPCLRRRLPPPGDLQAS
jgi:nitrate reductase beta subunit